MPIAKAVGGGGFWSARDRAELSLAPGRHDQRFCGSAHHRASHEHKIGREGGLARARAAYRRGVLFGRVRLAGEKRLVDVEIAGFNQSGIGGPEIAGGEKNVGAGHDLNRGNVDRLSVAKRLGGKRNLRAQALGGVLGLALLRHVEDNRHQQNGRDDDEARDVARERRDGGGEEQNQDQRIAEPSQKVRHQARVFGGGDLVRSGHLEDGGGVGRFQAGFGGVQPLNEIGERNDGEVRCFFPRLVRHAFW